MLLGADIKKRGDNIEKRGDNIELGFEAAGWPIRATFFCAEYIVL